MKNLMSLICLNFMYRGEDGNTVLFGLNTFLFMGVTVQWGGGVNLKQFNVLGIRKKMSQIRKIAPAHP